MLRGALQADRPLHRFLIEVGAITTQETSLSNFKPRKPQLFYLKMYRYLVLLAFLGTFALSANGSALPSNGGISGHVGKQVNLEPSATQRKPHVLRSMWMHDAHRFPIMALLSLAAALATASLIVQCFRALTSNRNIQEIPHSEGKIDVSESFGVSFGTHADILQA